jgi:hypothetical protein
MIGKVSTNILLYSDVVAGMDASRIGKSLSEAQREGEADYYPFSKGFMRLE